MLDYISVQIKKMKHSTFNASQNFIQKPSIKTIPIFTQRRSRASQTLANF